MSNTSYILHTTITITYYLLLKYIIFLATITMPLCQLPTSHSCNLNIIIIIIIFHQDETEISKSLILPIVLIKNIQIRIMIQVLKIRFTIVKR